MYKVVIQNVNQIYFSLQDHNGKRLSLTKYEIRKFHGLSLSEANHYKKFIPLGLSVFIQDDSFIESDFKVIDDILDEVEEKEVEEKEVEEKEVEEKEVEVLFPYSKDSLKELKKAELRDLCLKVDININKKTKADLIEDLVAYYGL